MFAALAESTNQTVSSLVRGWLMLHYQDKYNDGMAVSTKTNSYIWRKIDKDWFLTSPFHDTLWFARLSPHDKTPHLFKVVDSSPEVTVEVIVDLAKMVGITAIADPVVDGKKKVK